MRDASIETKANGFSLQSALEKSGMTYAVRLIGGYLALTHRIIRP